MSTLAIESGLVEHLHREAGEVMADIAGKNYVRVTVHRFQPVGRRWRWGAELVHDSRSDGGGLALLPSVVMMDQARMLAGRKPMFLKEAIRATGGELRSLAFNLRPNIGTDYVAQQLGSGAASATVAKNIALTNNTSAPAATDTATTTTAGQLDWGTATATDAAASNSRGEYTALGVARAAAAYAHTTSAASFSQTKQFTASGTVTSLQACGMFDSASQGAGNLFVENTFTATSLALNDQLTIAWTINI